jgi:hypothetical protein
MKGAGIGAPEGSAVDWLSRSGRRNDPPVAMTNEGQNPCTQLKSSLQVD